MCSVQKTRSILAENNDTSDVVLLFRCSNVVFEESYTSQGHYSIHDSTIVFVKRNIKGCKKLFTDYSAD